MLRKLEELIFLGARKPFHRYHDNRHTIARHISFNHTAYAVRLHDICRAIAKKDILHHHYYILTSQPIAFHSGINEFTF